MKKQKGLICSITTALTLALMVSPFTVSGVDAKDKTQSESATIVAADESKGYFRDADGTLWEFNALFNVSDGAADDISIDTAYANGVSVRKSEMENPYHVQNCETMNRSLRSGMVSPNALMLSDIEVIITEILNSVKVYDKEMIKKYDFFQDDVICLPDYIFAQRMRNCVPMNFVTNGDASNYDEMSYDDFFQILEQKEAAGQEVITIMYGDKPEAVEESTTTTVTTTATTEPTTSTTKATTTTTKPTTTTTSTTKATTTTTKPTTTTSTTKATTTTTKPTTMTTSTTKATTTTTKPTTTTTKPTTTTTSTTKATTTTTKPTTVTTSTTKATTTTTKPTTTTTSTTKATTTTETTTTTTTETTTTTTTTEPQATTTTADWNPPAMEDLVHEGEQIDQNTYDILLNTAKMFNIEKYQIVWSDHPIEYAYADPGLYYCMHNGIAYGYGVQIVSGTDVKGICPTMDNFTASDFEWNQYMCYRPLVEEDNAEKVMMNYEESYGSYRDFETGLVGMMIDDIIEPTYIYTEYIVLLKDENKFNPFEFINWYLIPIDENGEPVYELNKGEYTVTKTSVVSNYWWTIEELTPGSIILPRESFYRFVKTMDVYNFEDANVEFVYSEENVYYAYSDGDIRTDIGKCEIALQMIPTTDLVNLDPNIYQKYIDKGYSETEAKDIVDDIMRTKHDYYVWTYSDYVEDNQISQGEELFYITAYRHYPLDFYMVILDENGNPVEEIIRR